MGVTSKRSLLLYGTNIWTAKVKSSIKVAFETTINHSIFITNSYGGRDNIYINPNPTVLKNDLTTN